MNTSQLERLKMYLAVRVLLRSIPAILAKLPNAEEYLTALDAVILDIQKNSALQKAGASQVIDQYDKQKAKLIALLLENVTKLQSYAAYINDNLLLEFTKVTANKLNKMEDVALLEYANDLYAKVNNLLTALTRYGITAETQTVLLTETKLLETLYPQMTQALRNKKNITSDLAANYKKADGICSKLDKEVEIVRTTEPKFYADYKNLRKVTTPIDVVQLVGHILDSETGAGVPNATVTLTLSDGTKDPIVKTSADKGGFQVKTLAAGIYSVTVTKIGYQTQTLSITDMGDEPYDLVVRLVKTTNA